MDMNSMVEDQIVHDTIQAIGISGASSTMMRLSDILGNIEQMLVPFKRYIEAFKASITQALLMVQALPMAQAPPMTQALFVAQTTHTNVLAGNAKDTKFIKRKKFDGT
jgi:hypothetical protein